MMSFSTQDPANLPLDGYIPQDWDSPGNPPQGDQLVRGQGVLYNPPPVAMGTTAKKPKPKSKSKKKGAAPFVTPTTPTVYLWVGASMAPSGWVELGEVQGPPGPQGPAGAQGLQGAIGLQGPAGNDGAQGPQGTIGPQGPQGTTGTPGLPGTAGATGATGATGPAGPIGATGAAGAVGTQGPQGIQGPQGVPGPTAVSAQTGNTATLGTDGLIFVPTLPVATNAIPTMDGIGAAGTSTAWARGDHVHPTDTSRQPVAGVINASNAAAGNLGEVVSTSVTTGVSLSSGVVANVGSLALTPGDWDVNGQVVINSAANNPTRIAAGISNTTAALPTATQLAAGTGAANDLTMNLVKATFCLPTGTCRFNVSAATTVYLVALATVAGATATGFIYARRCR
jgi:hypothetical protein